MRIFKKTKKDNNQITEIKDIEKTEIEDTNEEKTNKVTETCKAIGAGLGFVLMFVGTVVMAGFAAALDDGTYSSNTRKKDWREDEDLFKDVDYSADSEESHQQVTIALDMTNVNDRNDCTKTYLWMYQNIDNMPQTVKTVISMTKGQIDQDKLNISQSDVYRWWSTDKDVAQKAIKQLKKYYSTETNNDDKSKIIIVKE